jgi:hypothetical protein
MLQVLNDLTPAERGSLKNPDFITKDEADLNRLQSARE